MVEFFGKKRTDECTTDFKTSMGREILKDIKDFEILLETRYDSKEYAGEWNTKLTEKKKSAMNNINKYIEKCGHIEISGKKFTNPDDAFKAQEEEIKRSGLMIPDEEEEY